MDNTAKASNETCDCDERMTERSLKLKTDLSARLNRVEGQIRGIKSMIEKDIYCDDVLHQITAAQAALKAVSLLLLKNHIKSCLVRKIKNDETEVIDELLVTIGKMV